MTDHLADITSDLSAFHRIDDAGQLEAAMFFALAVRLPAYRGVMRCVVEQHVRDEGGGRSGGRGAPRYERNSAMANNARMADRAPAASGSTLAVLNSQLGSQWFSHRTVSTSG